MPDSETGQHLLRQVRFLLVIMFVLLLASQIQLQLRNRDIDRMRDAVSTTHDAAIGANKAANKAATDLSAAIKASTAPQDPNGPIPTALREIHEIKILLQNLDSYVHNINGG